MKTNENKDNKTSECCGSQIVLTNVDQHTEERTYEDHCSSCYNKAKWK